jgi:hypothetical protein
MSSVGPPLRPPGMTTNIMIDLPDDPEEAVRRLRDELRAARRRRAHARQVTGFATYRRLPLAGMAPAPLRENRS